MENLEQENFEFSKIFVMSFDLNTFGFSHCYQELPNISRYDQTLDKISENFPWNFWDYPIEFSQNFLKYNHWIFLTFSLTFSKIFFREFDWNFFL